MLESEYPYTSGATGTDGACIYDASRATTVKTSGFTNIARNSVSDMKAALMDQPLAVAVMGGSSVFM